ncbi:polysaccharide biosynthesis/export family protein [Pseudoalteromonas rubra]|uniref:polysaccharide biosynthesis/export family protein n=1 Tax=Pseudoalteromonas rubra TaxID=43658 RepID=UPI000F76B393|nr:SLBB domain-containing protein [Pseudoalteromonas rubra]
MLFRRIFALIILSYSVFALAFTPTAEQLEEFQKLPKAQQEALAKQYGIDISSLNMGEESKQGEKNVKSSMLPRDEDGESDTGKDPFDPTVEPLKPFGYKLFSGIPSTFTPPEDASVPDDYILGRGDTVVINLYGKESNSYTLVIDSEGRLAIPEFSPVQVAGLSYAEFKSLIKNKVAKEAIGLSVFVAMAELRAVQVLVVGEVYQPGSYTLSPLSSVTHALFASGGVTEIASLRNIQVKRSGQAVTTLDLYDLLLDGDRSGDISLRSGDVVFIPSAGPQVTVEGAVKREGIFELTGQDKKDDLVKMFGGFKDNAYIKRVQVQRVQNGHKSIAVSADFSDPDDVFIPKGGDKVFVQSVNDVVVDSVTLLGAAARPGVYQWQSGLDISDIVHDLKSDLLPQADYHYGLVVREKSMAGDIEVIQFSFVDALKNKNVVLEKNDKVYVFSRFKFKQEEEQALAKLALTEEQLFQQEKVKLWHLFEYQEFKKKTLSFEEALEQSIEKQEEREKQRTKRGQKLGEEDEPGEFATFSREKLLMHLLPKLEFQASATTRKATFEVLGEVRFPGVYPLATDSTIADAISAAGGLLESAHPELAELASLSPENGQFNYVSIRLDSEEGRNYRLDSKDVLNILKQPNWQKGYKVHLKGEVRFPGTYTVSRGESLDELLKRAGGLSTYAEPKAAIYTRESIKEQEETRLLKLSDELRKDIASRSFQKSVGMNTSISYEDMKNLLDDLASVESIGRLVIDLPAILSRQENLVLQDGDTLYVPGKQDSISVIGEVNYASSHLYKEGVTIDDYLELSGGVKDRAKEEQIYVIKANGAVFIPQSSSWFAVNNKNELEAGDTIVVPMDASHMDNLTLWSTATQIFYQLGVGIAAIARI